MAKKAKNDGGGLDRISQFPDEILCQILSSLPTDEAVRTSILSSRWRYLFTSLTSFDVDISGLLTDRIGREGFAKFMLQMLYFRRETLEHFRLKRLKDCYVDFGRLYDWICAALYRNVKELELNISKWDFENFEGLPPDLYICKSLVKLKLDIPFWLEFPDEVLFSNLKILELHHLVFPESDTLQKLLSSSSCPVLEDLKICNCTTVNLQDQLNISNQSLKRLTLATSLTPQDGSVECLVLNVPSLVYLNYVDFVAWEYSIAEMGSLVKADIRFSRKNCEPAFAQLLQAVHHAKSLYLSIHHQALAFLPDDMPSLAFYNLVRLEILYNHQDWQATGLYEFLEVSPNLQTLVLSNANFDVSRAPPKEVPSCMLAHLKEIEISEFRGDIHLLEMIAYFLSNARVLEKLKVRMNDLEEQKRFSMTNQVLSLPRSSRKCQVVTDIS